MLNEQQNSNLRTRFQDHPRYFTNCRSFIRANIKDNVFHKGAEIIIHLLVPENQSVGESICVRVIAGVFNIENIQVNVQITSALQLAKGETISSDSLKCPFACFFPSFGHVLLSCRFFLDILVKHNQKNWQSMQLNQVVHSDSNRAKELRPKNFHL